MLSANAVVAIIAARTYLLELVGKLPVVFFFFLAEICFHFSLSSTIYSVFPMIVSEQPGPDLMPFEVSGIPSAHQSREIDLMSFGLGFGPYALAITP